MKRPRQVASIIPSSRLLRRRLVDCADVRSAKRIVELGPGTGGTTRTILRAMAPDAQLLSIEINPYLCGVVRRIRDERLIPHLGDASNLREIVAGYDFGKPEVVISGIPFSTMNQAPGAELLSVIESVLAPEGRFVAYQVSRKIESLRHPCSELATPEKRLVLFNVPPLWVLQWEKIAGSKEPSVH